MVYKHNIVTYAKRNVLRIGALLACLYACVGAQARDSVKVGLTYTVGADVVGNYIWRGIQVAGLGVQPDLSVGYGGAYIDLWGSVSATDWMFRKFYPEVDVSIGFNRWGLDVKYMAMYYFTGWENYTQEWRAKYRISDKLPLHIMWCTRTFGRDYYNVNENENVNKKRAYSSYLEVGYEFRLPYEMTLFANLGMTPWKSFYTGYQGGFAVVCIDAKLQRSWELSQRCYMNVFAQVMLNPYDMSRMAADESYQSINNGQQFLWNVGCGVYLK